MKSYLSKLGVILFGVMFAVAGCQDYDEDIRKVNEKLDNSVVEIQGTTDALEDAIDALKAKLEAEYATKKELADAKALLDAKDAEIAAAVAALDAAYKAADAALKAGYEGADAALKAELEKKIADAAAAAQKANDDLAAILEGMINGVQQEVAGVNSFINETLVPYFEGKLAEINAAVAALQAADVKTAADIAKVAADLAAAKTELETGYKAAIKTAVDELTAKINTNTEAIAALTLLHKNDVELLQQAIADNTTLAEGIRLQLINHIAEYKTTVDMLQGAMAEGDEEVRRQLMYALNTHIELYEQTVDQLQGAMQEGDEAVRQLLAITAEKLSEQHKADVEYLQGAIAENTTLAEGIRLQLIDHIAEYKRTIEYLEGVTSANEGEIAMLKVRMLALETLHATDMEHVQNVLNGLDVALQQETAQRKEADELLQANLDAVKAALDAHKKDYATTVEYITGLIGENTHRISLNETAIRNLQAKDEEIEGKIAELTEAYKKADEELAKLIAKNADDITAINKVLDQFHNNFTTINFELDMIVAALAQTIADLSNLEANVGILTERVQSLVYVPEYNDGKATINYAAVTNANLDITNLTDVTFVPGKSTLRYKVNSTSETAVDDLVAAWQQDKSILSFDLEGVEVRGASAKGAYLEIANVSKDKDGYLAVDVLARNFDPEFFWSSIKLARAQGDFSADIPFVGDLATLFEDIYQVAQQVRGSQSYSASLVLAQTDKKNDVASEFTNLIASRDYDHLLLAARYNVENKQVVLNAWESFPFAKYPYAQKHSIPSWNTEKVINTTANEPVVLVNYTGKAYTAEELYAETGYKVDIKKQRYVVSYTKDGKPFSADAKDWNTNINAYDNTKFNVVDPDAIGTSREVSLTAYEEADKAKYDERVYDYIDVVDTYYLEGQSVAVADKVTIEKNLVYINFEPKTIDWTLQRAINLRGNDEAKTPYSNDVEFEAKYDNIYDIAPIIVPANRIDESLTLNTKENNTPFVLTPISKPDAGKKGIAKITIKKGYEFAPADAKTPNEYVKTWKVSLNSTTDAIITVPVTFANYPAAVTVESECDLELVPGETWFDGKDALIADAYAAFGADNAGFAKDAKVNDLMFAALTDAANTLEDKFDGKAITTDPNINFVVLENADSSWVRLYNENIADVKDVKAEYEFTRDIKTWFGVPFNFIVTAKPHLPEIDLVRSTEYAKATDKDDVYTVDLQARVNAEGFYTVVNSDLAFYLNVAGEDANSTQSVSFAVIKGTGNIVDKVVPVDPLETALYNPELGLDITAYLKKTESILKWTDPGTQIEVKATLWAGAYPIDEATLILNVEDPLTFKAEDIVAERIVEADTPVKVFKNFTLTSTAKNYLGEIAHPGTNLINVNAADLSGILPADVKKAYNLTIATEMTTIYEQTANGTVIYDSSKYSWNKDTGILILKKDDAAQLLNPIVAEIKVTYSHNVHGKSDLCIESKTIKVTFQQTK